MPELVLVIGLPGSGKSTWIKEKYDYARLFQGDTVIISSDEMRKKLFKDENDQTHNEELFNYIKSN